MISTIWSFLQDKNNHSALAMVGSTIAAVAAVVWAIFKFVVSKREKPAALAVQNPEVSADHGSIVVRGNVVRSTLRTENQKPPED